MSDINVKCCRCRNKHKESERLEVPDKLFKGLGVNTLVCPRCRCTSYYRLDEKQPA
ncbi:hypothetical protein D3C77_585440 [compost metagenome]